MKHEGTKEKLYAAICALIVIVVLILYILLIIFTISNPGTIEGTILGFYGLVVIIMILGVLKAYRERIKEIDKDEIGDARKY